MPKTLSIFSLPLTAAPMVEVQHMVDSYLAEQRFHHIVTVNPEMLLYASKHPAYTTLLQDASLCIVDGVGIIVVGRLSGHRLSFIDRATGVDITSYLLGQAVKKALRVLIVLPSKTFRSREIMEGGLAARYPGLLFRIFQEGSEEPKSVLEDFDPNIVFTAQGIPLQEEWIDKHRALLQRVTIAMGVGGTFDFLSGTIQRAPGFMRALGLEWLFRFIQEPKRFKRIFRATVIFPVKALLYR